MIVEITLLHAYTTKQPQIAYAKGVELISELHRFKFVTTQTK